MSYGRNSPLFASGAGSVVICYRLGAPFSACLNKVTVTVTVTVVVVQAIVSRGEEVVFNPVGHLVAIVGM